MASVAPEAEVVVTGSLIASSVLAAGSMDGSTPLGHLVGVVSYLGGDTVDKVEIPVELTDHVEETFAFDKDLWAAANVAKQKVHRCHGKPGLFASARAPCTEAGPCLLPDSALFIICPVACVPHIKFATCVPHCDVAWPAHADKALIMTDKGLIGRNRENNWKGISWDGVGDIIVRTYDGKRCLSSNFWFGRLDPRVPWADPLAWIIPCGLLVPLCGYVCIQPNTPGLYHVIITSKHMTVIHTGVGDDLDTQDVPTATIELIALAASPGELVEALKRANGGSTPVAVKGLTMER